MPSINTIPGSLVSTVRILHKTGEDMITSESITPSILRRLSVLYRTPIKTLYLTTINPLSTNYIGPLSHPHLIILLLHSSKHQIFISTPPSPISLLPFSTYLIVLPPSTPFIIKSISKSILPLSIYSTNSSIVTSIPKELNTNNPLSPYSIIKLTK